MPRWSVAATSVLAAGLLAVAASPAFASSATVGTLHPAGDVTLRSLPAKPVKGAVPHTASGADLLRVADPLDALEAAAGSVGSAFPSPSPFSIVNSPDRQGWEGITQVEQHQAPGNAFTVTPPDQGLCVGSYKGQTYVFESVNNALQVYDAQGVQQLPGAVSLNAFFAVPPELDQSGTFGPATSDPKCWFDPQTHHWFHTVLVYGFDPNTGALRPPAFTAVAVSATQDPLGRYHLYRIPALDLGQPNCPCFGDQPLLGGDQYGFYVSTAEYSMAQPTSNFAQLYAMSKQALIAGSPLRYAHFRNLTNAGIGGRTTATVQPAFTDAPGQNQLAGNGTEFFLSGFDCVPVSCDIAPGSFNKITFWALTNTRSLQTANPTLHLSSQQLAVPRYSSPPWQFQKPGPLPLGCDPALKAGCHTPPVSANDARMNQVVYSHGELWSGINTAVGPGKRVGIEYFIVKPHVGSGAALKVNATVAHAGYVSATNENVSFPSVGVNAAGRGVIAFSVMGRAYDPSAGYVPVSTTGARGPIRVVASGFRPEDDFSCYKALQAGGPPCRWGDYSASVAGPDGRIWSAAEWIGPHARTINANWSTFVFPVKP